MFAVVLFFFGQQPQHYLVPNLVARRITFGNGYKLTIPHDCNVFVLSAHSRDGDQLLQTTVITVSRRW